jgi:hypothetical protein
MVPMHHRSNVPPKPTLRARASAPLTTVGPVRYKGNEEAQARRGGNGWAGAMMWGRVPLAAGGQPREACAGRAEQAAERSESGLSVGRSSRFGSSASEEVSSNVNQKAPPVSSRLIFSQEGVGRLDCCPEFLGGNLEVRMGFLQGRHERAPMATKNVARRERTV